MNGKTSFQGVFRADTGQSLLAQSDLRIKVEPTSNSNHWLLVGNQNAAPLVFLENGSVLIPQAAYQEGKQKLDQLRRTETR